MRLPCQLEPTGLKGADGKWPDGLTTLPFERGLSLAWDVTVPHPLAPSYLRSAATLSDAVACEAESKKRAKYAFLDGRVLFEPFVVKTHGAFGPAAQWLVGRLAQRSRDVGLARSLLEYRSCFARRSLRRKRSLRCGSVFARYAVYITNTDSCARISLFLSLSLSLL